MIHVEAVKVLELPTLEAVAIREAEAEAVEFHAQFNAWNEEYARLTGLRKVAGLIIKNREAANLSVVAYLDGNVALFTESEKEILINVALDRCKDESIEDDIRAVQILRWVHHVQIVHRAMRNETLEEIIGIPAKLIEQIK